VPHAPTPAPARPGPEARPAGEDDLWRIVSFDEAEDATHFSASFEAALDKVDTHLESLVQEPAARGANVGEPPEAAVGRAMGSPPVPPSGFVTPPGDKALATGQTAQNTSSGGALDDGLDGQDDLSDLDAWDFDEDDVAGDPSNPDEAAKLRRQRLLRRAMENMGALGTRPEAPVSAVPAAPAPSAEPTPAVAAAAPLGAEDAGLAQHIEKRYAEIQGKRDHFAILGITPETPREQVKAAFLSLAKVFHPDRLPASLPHLAPKITSVFESIREAYEILYDEAKRTAYLEGLKKAAAPKPPPASTAPGVSPAGRGASASNPGDLFKMGEVFFRKRDFVAAADHFDRANTLEPKALYQAALAWTIYMDPQRKAEMPKAKQMMADAVKADAACDRAHYQLGVIARVEGDMEKAERHFRDAVKANPKHLEANQELRLIEMRKKNTPPPKKGFFR
jgi:tetratricopeptide (TPR) repeat protein